MVASSGVRYGPRALLFEFDDALSDDKSCLVRYLSAYTRLSEDDHALLADFERDEREYAAGARLKARGDVVDELLVVRGGWLFAATELEDGRRHVVRTYHGGDIVGLGELAVPSMSSDLIAATAVRVCPVPKAALGRVFEYAPRLAALLLAMSARDQVLLVELLRAAARMNAKDRIVFALLSWLHRLALTNPGMSDTFSLRLNQSEIGDMLGLTNVSVSKALVELEAEGKIRRRRQEVTLVDIPRLSERVDFVDRYTTLDMSWFPNSDR